MNPNTEGYASFLVRQYGCTVASEMAGHKIRRWAELAASPSVTSPAPLASLRYWLGVDWHLHHNPTLPTEN